MALTFRDAMADDVGAITLLRNAVADATTKRFGAGHWSRSVTERGTLHSLKHARVRTGWLDGNLVSVLRLAPKKPWAIDVAYFTPVERALYLTDLAVAVARQGQGLGRAALRDAMAVAGAWPAGAVRLDAYDHDAGAGPFYAAGGFTERGRVVYRGTPLIYYERLL